MFLALESIEKHKIDCYEAEGLSLLLNLKWDRDVYVKWLKIRRNALKTSPIKSPGSVYHLLREVFLTRDHLKFLADKIMPGNAKKVQEWVESKELELKVVKKRLRAVKFKPKPVKTLRKKKNGVVEPTQEEKDKFYVEKNSELLQTELTGASMIGLRLIKLVMDASLKTDSETGSTDEDSELEKKNSLIE